MLPIRDYNPPRRRALLTWGLILINFGVYFYLAQNPVMDENAIARYAVIPADITAGRHLGTLITSMFLHANLLHVAGNMLFLWIFGNNVEDKLGELKFLVVYFPRARILTFVVPLFIFTLPAYVFIGYWIALQALNAFLNIGAIGGGVAFFAHVGGFGTGLILALLLRPREHVDPHPGYGGYP